MLVLKREIIFVFRFMLCFFLFTSCNQAKKGSNKPNIPKTYSALTVIPRPATIYFDFPATIQGVVVVEIRPKVDGYVQTIYVNEGATVRKGQLLFKLSNPQYNEDVVTAKAGIKIAQADVDAARENVNKVRPLVEKDIVSRYELTSAQYTLESKIAALAQAKATLANAETNVGYTEIRSPLNGVIGSIPYKIGALISSNTSQPLTTLSDISQVYAYYALNERQLLNFSLHFPGATLQEKLSHLPPATLILANDTVLPHKGKIETASGLITTTTGTASFKALFDNPEGMARSGASAIVRIPRSYDSALLVPPGAIYEIQNKQFVYQLFPGNRVISKAITTTPTSDGRFVIIDSGLKQGDKIIVDAYNIKDSSVVKVKPANADSIFKNYTSPQ
jgi:membrane fusion protein (multidrug efflux system)